MVSQYTKKYSYVIWYKQQILMKLEMWGRAQHEAAQCRTSDLKSILGVLRCVKI